MMPSRHRELSASKTPDPEFPVLATSGIKVGNMARTRGVMAVGVKSLERAVPSGVATITADPGGGIW